MTTFSGNTKIGEFSFVSEISHISAFSANNQIPDFSSTATLTHQGNVVIPVPNLDYGPFSDLQIYDGLNPVSSTSLNAFINGALQTNIDYSKTSTDYWSNCFAGAAASYVGYSVPNNYSVGSSWNGQEVPIEEVVPGNYCLLSSGIIGLVVGIQSFFLTNGVYANLIVIMSGATGNIKLSFPDSGTKFYSLLLSQTYINSSGVYTGSNQYPLSSGTPTAPSSGNSGDSSLPLSQILPALTSLGSNLSNLFSGSTPTVPNTSGENSAISTPTTPDSIYGTYDMNSGGVPPSNIDATNNPNSLTPAFDATKPDAVNDPNSLTPSFDATSNPYGSLSTQGLDNPYGSLSTEGLKPDAVNDPNSLTPAYDPSNNSANQTQNSSAERKGAATGNEDTPASNNALKQQGPMDGTTKPDVQGRPGSYQQTTVNSICSRVPTHEPWPGHPRSRVQERKGTNASSNAGGNPSSNSPANSPSISSPSGGGGGGGSAGGASGGTSSGGAAAPVAGLRGNTIQEQVYNFYIDKGYSAYAAAGMVGNFKIETGGFKSGVINGTITGDHGTAFGIAQWRGARVRNFERLLGHDLVGASLIEQLQFSDWEMKNTERGAYNAIKNATSASQAAALIDKYYERSDGTARQSRMNAAEQAYSQFGNGTSAPVNNGTSVGQIGQNPTNNSTPSSPQSNTSAPSTDGLTQPSSDQSSKDDVERADPGPQKATSGKSESKSKDKTYAESPKYNPKTKQNPNSPGGDGGGSDKKASTSKSSGGDSSSKSDGSSGSSSSESTGSGSGSGDGSTGAATGADTSTTSTNPSGGEGQNTSGNDVIVVHVPYGNKPQ